jgi:hypothetical protein
MDHQPTRSEYRVTDPCVQNVPGHHSYVSVTPRTRQHRPYQPHPKINLTQRGADEVTAQDRQSVPLADLCSRVALGLDGKVVGHRRDRDTRFGLIFPEGRTTSVVVYRAVNFRSLDSCGKHEVASFLGAQLPINTAMGISYELLDADGGVPYPGSAILGCRGDTFAVRGPGDAVDRFSVCAYNDDFGTGLSIPYSHGSVLRSGGQPLTVR